MSLEDKRYYLFVNYGQGDGDKVLESYQPNQFVLSDQTWQRGTLQAFYVEVHSNDLVTLTTDGEFVTLSGNQLITVPDVSTINSQKNPPDPYRYWDVQLGTGDHLGTDFYTIRNNKTNHLLAFNPKTQKVECTRATESDDALWHPVLLPDLDGLDADGKSGREWEDIAKEIFNEGYKLIKFAGDDQWQNIGEDAQQEYANMFYQLGQDRGVAEI